MWVVLKEDVLCGFYAAESEFFFTLNTKNS